MQAVILAGGAGTRLYPLTVEMPKPMLDINGRPFLQYVLECLSSSGVHKFVLCLGYLADKFKLYFGDGKRFGWQIDYSVESDFLGTAGALKLAEPFLKDFFLVLNGDTYLPLDYQQLYSKFKQRNKLGLMVVYDNGLGEVAQSNIAIDENDLVISYAKQEPLKKGNKPRPLNPPLHGRWRGGNSAVGGEGVRYIDAGAYVFKREILDLINKDKFVSLETDIYPELIKTGELGAYVTKQKYYDMGTPERLALVKEVLK